ncbi:MAG: hypothetical protein ACI9MC_002147 [Kiritimatiellia bacterium]
MSVLGSFRDVLLVAWFELVRAIRTWQALALVSLYMVVNVGFALLFIGALGVLENQVAGTLGVPATTYPGAMLDQLVADGQLLEPLVAMVGDKDLVETMLTYPLLAIFQLFVGLRMNPFLAAMTAAEAVAVDTRSRSVRFELLRTGRLEWVTGRYLGQVLLNGLALLLASAGVWVAGMTLMVEQDPVWLATSLLLMALRTWVFCLPFVGLGIACSQVTNSPAWARVMAIGGTAVAWVVWGLLQVDVSWRIPWLWDTVSHLFPWHWLLMLWTHDYRLAIGLGVCTLMGLVSMGVGYARFHWRDL